MASICATPTRSLRIATPSEAPPLQSTASQGFGPSSASKCRTQPSWTMRQRASGSARAGNAAAQPAARARTKRSQARRPGLPIRLTKSIFSMSSGAIRNLDSSVFNRLRRQSQPGVTAKHPSDRLVPRGAAPQATHLEGRSSGQLGVIWNVLRDACFAGSSGRGRCRRPPCQLQPRFKCFQWVAAPIATRRNTRRLRRLWIATLRSR